MNWGLLVFGLVVAVFFILPKLRQVKAEEAVQLLVQGAAFIDVRTREEYARQAIPGSRNLPLHELVQAVQQQKLSPSDPILVFCHSGMRSANAQRQLKSVGYTRVYNVGSFSRARKISGLSRNAGDATRNR